MREPFNQLSDEYNELYIKNIIDFQRKCSTEKDAQKKYVDFYPSFGIKRNEPCDFLVYGQAVYGWGSGFLLDTHLQSPSEKENKIKESIDASNSYIKDHSPLDWVNVYWARSTWQQMTQDESMKKFYSDIDYTTSRSFFWNVVYKLINRYYGFDENSLCWAKKMIWSNLYKIAPEWANPNEDEKKLQEKISIQLVKKEIKELRPKFCIILTNQSWWNPFKIGQKGLQTDFSKHGDQITSVEFYKRTKIIVTTRPWNRGNEKHVKQILQLIQDL